MPRNPKLPQIDQTNKTLRRLARLVRQEVHERHGSELTFEQRRDFGAQVAHEALWLDEEEDLQGLVTHADEIVVEDKRYRRLEQPSGATYQGRWGVHVVDEPLYRQLGVQNGATLKPLEVRAGIIENMTPDLARITGELSAEHTSRQVVSTMRTVGLVPASRSFFEKHIKRMATELASEIEDLEQASRVADPPPTQVASISCGMDRGAVRMVELQDPETAPPRQRSRPYERTPPPPSELHYRMAWNGNVTLYDGQGEPLRTLRYAAEADANAADMARRISADVEWVVRHCPGIDVQCIQDAAPELRVLVETLRRTLSANTDVEVHDLVDFEHLMGYLNAVVDACYPASDADDWKAWYRAELLQDDGAIDRIWRRLRELGKSLPAHAYKKRNAVAAALRYIRKRKDRMRYASLHARGLTVGSGDTENTVWLMQQRVKRAGQSWQPSGLRGILAIRALVLSERWDTGWKAYAARHRTEVQCAA